MVHPVVDWPRKHVTQTRSSNGMKVVPLNDKIVVKRMEAEEKTAGGIVLPDTAKEKPKQGKVLSLGDGKLLETGKRAAFQVKEGDRVLFTSYAGNEVSLDGEEYLIMTEDDILAVVE
jgi:chaperonin GroES